MSVKHYYSRIKEKEGRLFYQHLVDHLTEVGDLASQFANKIGMSESGRVMGRMHDFGKFSDEFQTYLLSHYTENPDLDNDEDESDYSNKRVDHSTAGGKYINEECNALPQLLKDILSIGVYSHHSGLIDVVNENEHRLDKRTRKLDINNRIYQDCIKNCNAISKSFLSDTFNVERTKKLNYEIFNINKTIINLGIENNDDIHYNYLGLVTKFLFSCLIDADRIDSASFEFPAARKHLLSNEKPNWKSHLRVLQLTLDHYKYHSNGDKVNNIREEISDTCARVGKEESSGVIKTLTVPTGGGKTLSSLRFALEHAQKNNLDRIVYIVPYTAIIEQNAEEVRKILEPHDSVKGKYVLEHHSNTDPDKSTWISKVTSENWNCDIVFTTMVQYLECLFGSGTKAIRRFHQLANSVLIFDEIQTIEPEHTCLFNLSINFLTKMANSTAVLCTATQPVLNNEIFKRFGRILLDENSEITDKNYSHDLKRVKFSVVEDQNRKIKKHTVDELSEFLVDRFNEDDINSVLMVCNTKSWARNLTEKCQELFKYRKKSIPVYHLSTSMCAKHRNDVLKEVKEKLKNNEPVLCISTQLIEAGTDIDFNCAVRIVAGIDSILQTGGRCNRHGKMKNKGIVYIVDVDDDKIYPLRNIMIGKNISRRQFFNDVRRSNIHVLSEVQEYFNNYFRDMKKYLTYPVYSENSHKVPKFKIYDLLSSNRENIYLKNDFRLKQSFKMASDNFESISGRTTSILVVYDNNSADIINELKDLYKKLESGQDIDYARLYTLRRKSHQYFVNIYDSQFKVFSDDSVGLIKEIHEGTGMYYLTNDLYYDTCFGLENQV